MTDWITVNEAADLTGYTKTTIRRLAEWGRVTARRWVHEWMIDRQSLLEYQASMQALGNQVRTPWAHLRPDLEAQRRGRRRGDPPAPTTGKRKKVTP